MFAPSSERWSLDFVSLFGRGDLWLFGYGPNPSSVEVDCDCIASVALYWLREEFGTPSGLKILLGEGGDVELRARTSKHIFVFAFDPLTLNSLSFICALHLFILLIIYYMLGLCVCVPHLYLTTRASYSTSTLIQRNQEELVQSPSRGIRLHSLVVLSVVTN